MIKYFLITKEIEKETFHSKILKDLQTTSLLEGKDASSSFQQLIKLIEALDNRSNGLAAIVLNSLLLWDINCMCRIELWVEKARKAYPKWIHTIEEIDALNSLANFKYNYPNYVTPEIRNSDTFHLEIEKGGHPLIDKKELVTNDLVQTGNPNLLLITGANMAGKSTFLRMIGVNMVLTICGTSACAQKLILTPIQLFTSMRTSDSVQAQTSFFFAELKRLKFIVDQVEQLPKTYFLLDEILKGTNSKDQHTGARRLIENFLKLKGAGIVATHDIELTDIRNEHPDFIRNIAFEIGMENNQMVFDYQYKEGVCQNMNATMLMEQMEIF